MLDQLDTNFRSLSYSELIVKKVGNIADLLAVHPDFQPSCPDFVSNPEQLKVLVNNVKNALNASSDGDRRKIADRNSARAELELSAAITAQYLIMKSIKEKDPGRLLNTGFTIKNRPHSGKSAGSSATKPGTPDGFIVKLGPDSGTVVAKVKKVPFAATYELQFCQEAPAGEQSWNSAGQFVYCRKMEVKDLEPAQRYYFRIRCHGAKGPGLWSANVNLIVI